MSQEKMTSNETKADHYPPGFPNEHQKNNEKDNKHQLISHIYPIQPMSSVVNADATQKNHEHSQQKSVFDSKKQ